jgi:hypothetical protein
MMAAMIMVARRDPNQFAEGPMVMPVTNAHETDMFDDGSGSGRRRLAGHNGGCHGCGQRSAQGHGTDGANTE